MHQFDSGAKRGAVLSTRYDLITSSLLDRTSITLSEGAERYGVDNWKKGLPSADVFNHLIAHLLSWRDGDRSEDHLAHATCNIMFLMYSED